MFSFSHPISVYSEPFRAAIDKRSIYCAVRHLMVDLIKIIECARALFDAFD